MSPNYIERKLIYALSSAVKYQMLENPAYSVLTSYFLSLLILSIYYLLFLSDLCNTILHVIFQADIFKTEKYPWVKF